MGLFGRSKKNDAVESNSESKSKRRGQKKLKKITRMQAPVKSQSKKGAKVKKGKRNQQTLVERMQLEESVADATLDVLQELVRMGGSAVRGVDEGYLIVAITNEMLEQADLDPAGEDFGSLAEGLLSETIESITLVKDLEDNVIGIIPTAETLMALDEYDFAQDLDFKWAIVPYDLTDESQLVLLDATVSLAQLIEMANNPSQTVRIENGDVNIVSDDEPDDDVADLDDELDADEQGYDDVPSFDSAPSFDDTFDDTFDDEPVFNEPSFDDDVDDVSDMDEPSYDDGLYDDDSDYADLSYPSDDGLALDDEVIDDVDTALDEPLDDLTAEEVTSVVERVSQLGFNNTELDIAVDVSLFDAYFDAIEVAQFDTTKHEDGELHDVIVKLRQDANAELRRFHQEHIVSLRNTYITTMRDAHNKLVEALDHKNAEKPYGAKFLEIESEFDEQMDNLDRLVAAETDAIINRYNKDREEYAENARREALAVYDSRYRETKDRKIEAVKDHVRSELQTKRDIEIGELYRDRQIVAKRLYDKTATALLRDLQEKYQEISERELEMYDAFRKDMDVYLRRHFADEVLRAKAEAEALRQSHEAERVRAEYEAMLTARAKQLEERDAENRENIRKLEESHRQQLEQVMADYQARIDREQRENQNLRDMLQESNRTNAKIGEQKDKEIEHNITVLKNTLKATQEELAMANKRAEHAQKPMWIVIIAVATIGIALGIIFGFMYGANSTYSFAPTEQDQSVNISHHEVDMPLIINPAGESLV